MKDFSYTIDFYYILADHVGMDGLTIDEMCEKLKLPFKTVETRIQRAGIKPKTKQAIYPYETLDIIKNVAMGRPKKAADREPVKPNSGKTKPGKPKPGNKAKPRKET
jgi:hypothetical protein